MLDTELSLRFDFLSIDSLSWSHPSTFWLLDRDVGAFCGRSQWTFNGSSTRDFTWTRTWPNTDCIFTEA